MAESDISTSSSSENLNKGIRLDPPGEENTSTHSLLHSISNLPRDSMISRLGFTFGNNPKTSDLFHGPGLRQPSPQLADQASSIAALPVAATIPGNTANCSFPSSTATVSAPHPYHPGVSHIGRSSVAHYVNVPDATQSSLSSSPSRSVHTSPLASSNTSPMASMQHIYIHPTSQHATMMANPGLYYDSSEMVMSPPTPKEINHQYICSGGSMDHLQQNQFIPSYAGPRPNIIEGAAPVPMNSFMEYPANISPDNTSVSDLRFVNKNPMQREPLNHVQQYLNMLNMGHASASPILSDSEINNNTLYKIHQPRMESCSSLPANYVTPESINL